MLKKLQRSSLTISTKLSVTTLAAVTVIMVILLLVINARVTSSMQQQAETSLLQSTDMVHGFLSRSDQDLRERTQQLAITFKNDNARHAQLLEFGHRKVLLLNGASVNGDHAFLEKFQATTAAATTIFIFTGDTFTSIATSLKQENGSPATGMHIDPQSPMYLALRQGKDYLGLTSLLGKEYMAHYSPLLDDSQRLVGAIFTGMDFSNYLHNLKQMLRDMQVGQQGYYFVMQTTGANRGQVLVHPRVEGDILWERQDSQGGKYIQHMLSLPRGLHVYDVVGNNQSTRTMVTAFRSFEPWNWTLAASINATEVQQASQQLRGIFISLGLAGIALLCGCIYWLIRRTVVTPLGQALSVTQALATGDLSQRASVHSHDEMGQLLTAINSTADALDSLIRTVQHKAHGVSLASEEIARGNADLASRTESSASALEETAAAMEELGATVRHNADSATTADGLTHQAQAVVNASGSAVSALVQTMNGIDQSSQRIADILGVIDGIAFQTNILALNAAVEAARAGEHGRGFAVVASEVRALAGRCAEAAKEIKTLIQQSSDEVRAGNERASTAGQAMQEAIHEIHKVSRVISEISHASAEQNHGVGQVAEAISHMDQATQKNAALVEEVSAAAQSLSNQAHELLEAVAIFKLRQGRHTSAAQHTARIEPQA